MMLKIGVPLMAVFALFSFLTSPAWGEFSSLTGFGAVTVEVKIVGGETKEDVAKACSVKEKPLEVSLTYPISLSRIKIKISSELHITARIFPTFLKEVDSCFSYVELTAWIERTLYFGRSKKYFKFPIRLWIQETVLWGPRASHANHIQKSLERMAKRFVVDWTAAQQ